MVTESSSRCAHCWWILLSIINYVDGEWSLYMEHTAGRRSISFIWMWMPADFLNKLALLFQVFFMRGNVCTIIYGLLPIQRKVRFLNMAASAAPDLPARSGPDDFPTVQTTIEIIPSLLNYLSKLKNSIPRLSWPKWHGNWHQVASKPSKKPRLKN